MENADYAKKKNNVCTQNYAHAQGFGMCKTANYEISYPPAKIPNLKKRCAIVVRDRLK